jgi:hypothetical protein
MTFKLDEALRNKTALRASKDEALLEIARDECRNFLFSTASIETRTLFISAWISGFATAHALDRSARPDPEERGGEDEEEGNEPSPPLPPDTLSPQMYR